MKGAGALSTEGWHEAKVTGDNCLWFSLILVLYGAGGRIRDAAASAVHGVLPV